MNGNVDNKANHEKTTYFMWSQLLGKAACITHRLSLCYYPKLARWPISGPDGMFNSSDHLLWLSLSPVQNVALSTNNPWPSLSLVLRCCPESACCARPKENPLPEPGQRIVGLDGLHT